MEPARAGSNILAFFAIMFLLGFGFVVYAVPATLDSSTSTTSNGTQGGSIYYHLVQVASTAKGTPGANASGYAAISVSGQLLSLVWYVTAAAPGEQLQLVMKAVGTTSTAAKSFTFAAVQVTALGGASSTASATLDPGTYSIGLTLVDPSSNALSTIFTSDPASVQVVIRSPQAATATTTTQTSSTTPTNTAAGSGLSYSLVPLPVYLGKVTPTDSSFKQGGALIIVSGNQLRITTSFLGTPNTQFFTVVQTGHQNITAGAATTTSTGGGVFKGNVTLASGTYQVGLLIYVAGNTSSPVAVSVPRAIQITLPVTTDGSSATTKSSSSTSTSNRESSTTSTSHAASTTSTTTTATTASESSRAQQLLFARATTLGPPSDYPFGQGAGGYAVTGGSVYFSLAFTGQSPNAHYSLVLTVNGTAKTIQNYTANAGGSANFGVSAALGTGSFLLGLRVFDLSSFNAPTVVLASVPASFVVNAHSTSASSSSTRTATSSSTSTETSRGAAWTFKLVPSTTANAPRGYRFATSGTAVVTLQPHFSLLDVVLGFHDANPSTTYNAALVLNGTSINLGSMTTNKGGAAELHASIQVGPGTYLLGLMVYDVSDIAAFGADGPILVMVSNPNTQLAVIVPATDEGSSTTTSAASSSSQGSNSQSVVTSTVTKTVTTISAGSEVEDQIKHAVDNLTIPATVQVTPLSSSTSVRDSRFSLSVGQQVGNGLAIAISGENVTGPRVLLINISKTSPLALYPSLNITLDGMQVVEAASAIQVLNPSSTDPPRYVLVATANSIQLLVSIPHFSLHLIQVAGQLVHSLEASLALDGPLLAGSIIVITLAFAGAYAARKRYFSILP